MYILQTYLNKMNEMSEMSCIKSAMEIISLTVIILQIDSKKKNHAISSASSRSALICYQKQIGDEVSRRCSPVYFSYWKNHRSK